MNDISSILIRPRITEKASRSAESSVYVFEVGQKATKSTISKAFTARFKITPLKVTTVTISPRAVFVRGKRGTQSGYKKAYIYLKPGTKLEN
jgi:large subunit ribosomal protein L23